MGIFETLSPGLDQEKVDKHRSETAQDLGEEAVGDTVEVSPPPEEAVEGYFGPLSARLDMPADVLAAGVETPAPAAPIVQETPPLHEGNPSSEQPVLSHEDYKAQLRAAGMELGKPVSEGLRPDLSPPRRPLTPEERARVEALKEGDAPGVEGEFLPPTPPAPEKPKAPPTEVENDIDLSEVSIFDERPLPPPNTQPPRGPSPLEERRRELRANNRRTNPDNPQGQWFIGGTF